MAKLVWRVKLISELGSGILSETEVARIERDDFAVAETVGLTLDEGKRLVRPGLGFASLLTARRTLAGYEVMAMIRKGQVHNIDGLDMRAQTVFVATLFQMAA